MKSMLFAHGTKPKQNRYYGGEKCTRYQCSYKKRAREGSHCSFAHDSCCPRITAFQAQFQRFMQYRPLKCNNPPPPPHLAKQESKSFARELHKERERQKQQANEKQNPNHVEGQDQGCKGFYN